MSEEFKVGDKLSSSARDTIRAMQKKQSEGDSIARHREATSVLALTG